MDEKPLLNPSAEEAQEIQLTIVVPPSEIQENIPKPPKKQAKKDEVLPYFSSYTILRPHFAIIWKVTKTIAAFFLVFCLFYRIASLGVLDDFFKTQDCKMTLSSGNWVAKQWHPASCALATYSANQISKCLKNSTVFFFGDSTMRQIYYALQSKLVPSLGNTSPAHSDLNFTASDIDVLFFWDPFLNSSKTRELLQGNTSTTKEISIMMFSAASWFLKYTSDKSKSFAESTNAINSLVSSKVDKPMARLGSFARLQPPYVEDLLNAERKPFLRNSELHLYNLHLFSLHPSDTSPMKLTNPAFHAVSSVPFESIDGLHYSNAVNVAELDLLLNEVCNPSSVGGMQGKSTCCTDYKSVSIFQYAVFILFVIFGPLSYLFSFTKKEFKYLPGEKFAYAIMVFGSVVFYCWLVDRTTIADKVNKTYNFWTFIAFNVAWIVPGVWSMCAFSDTTFLNRLQTDEWKGWMQFAILVYHYLGASKIVPVYSVIRVFVASYLFMTGFGHFTFFYKKKDFSILRIMRVVVRLNILSLALAYVMNTDLLFYYFGPLVTFWFMVVYGIMAIGSHLNQNHFFLVFKLFVGCLLTFLFTSVEYVYTPFFQFFNVVLKTKWDIRESIFRLSLDNYVVIYGMLCAYVMILISGSGESSKPMCNFVTRNWEFVKRVSLVTSVLIILVYTVIVILMWYPPTQPILAIGKTMNNAYHPLFSLFVVTAFIVLRNYTREARGVSSEFFQWIGRFSLETFIFQYHIWMGVDTYGLVKICGDGIVSFVVITIVFLASSEAVGDVCGLLVEEMVGNGKVKDWNLGLRMLNFGLFFAVLNWII